MRPLDRKFSPLAFILIAAMVFSACSPEPTPTGTPYPPPGDTSVPQESAYPPPEDTSGSAYPPPQDTQSPSSGDTPYPPPGETQTPAGNITPTAPAGTAGPTSYPGPQDTLPPAPTLDVTTSSTDAPRPTSTFNFDLTPTLTISPALTATPRPISTAMPPPGTIAQTIRIWHSWSAGEVQILDYVLKTFQDYYPDVAFDVLYLPEDELYGRYEMAAYRGDGPSLLFGRAEWGPLLSQKGLVADLSMDADPRFLAEINPPALGSARYQGALLGLPHRIRDGVLLYRNTSILPERPATYYELIQMAQAATRGGNVGGYLERSFLFSAAHLYGLGGRLMDDQGLPAFNTPQGVAWFNLLKSFEQAGAADFNSDRDLDLFKEGRVGLVIAGSWNRDELTEAIGAENLAIDPWPMVDGGRMSGFVQADLIFLNADLRGEERYAALLFMGFMLAREVQSILAKVGHIPAVRGVEVEDPLVRQAMLAFEAGTPYPVDPALPVYWDPLEAAMQAVFTAGADPQAALQAAQDEINAKLK